MAVEELIFEFFQIPSSALTGVVVNDLINFILVPSIVLLVFLEFASSLFLRNMEGNFKHLVSLAFFLIMVTQGFYGPFAIFAGSYMILFLIFALALFIVTRFLRPEHGFRVGAAVGEAAKSKPTVFEKQKLRIELKKQIKELEQIVAERQRDMNSSSLTDHEKAEIRRQIGHYQNELNGRRSELRKLNSWF